MKFKMKSGETLTVIKKTSSKNVEVTFDGVNTLTVEWCQISRGTIKNPMTPSIYGVGFFGFGSEKSRTKSYSCWFQMIRRCYDPYTINSNPSYIHAKVCNEWLNYQSFADWYKNNYRDGFELDKDIKIPGNKIYSPESCMFVPPEINSFCAPVIKRKNNLPLGLIYSKRCYSAQVHTQKGRERLYTKSFSEAVEFYRNNKISRAIDLCKKHMPNDIDFLSMLISKVEHDVNVIKKSQAVIK